MPRLDRAHGGDRLADGHRRRAAGVELCHLPDHRHARGHRPGRPPRGRRPVLRHLRRRPPPPAPAPDRRAVPVQDLRRRLPQAGDRDGQQAGQAGGDRALDADAALPARRGDPRLLARAVPRATCATSARRTSASASTPARRARLGRLHRGPAGQQERLAQPLDRAQHAGGVHRAQQPRDRPLLARGAAQHRHPHLPGRGLRLGAQQGRRPTSCCWSTCSTSTPATS